MVRAPRGRVVFGFLGTQLDAGTSAKRWERWRPTVGLVGTDAGVVDGLELFICKEQDQALAAQVAADVKEKSPATSVVVHNLNLADPWDFASVYAALQDFALEYAFDEGTDYFLHLATGTHVAQICLFLLAEARYFPAKLVSGGKGAGAEPWRGNFQVVDLDLSAYDQLASRFAHEHENSQQLLKGGIVTRNPAFNTLIARVEKVSLRSSAPILLTGPTGAGKSQLAARIHQLRALKHAAGSAFVEVNCATLRGDNAMSALFGHKKGAFTGAVSDRPGLLKAAEGGTLFLDEVGELGLDEQAMLLRALEEMRFLPLGSDKETTSSFQLLAGTNKDLAAEVAKGNFRLDLLARINQWSFELPGLADRPEDIEPNLDFEMTRAGAEQGVRVTMNRDAREAYLRFALSAPWPGNFRDLRASVSRMATLCEGGRIRVEDVELELEQLHRQRNLAAPAQASSASAGLANQVLGARAAEFDAFDLAQADAVFQVVAQAKSLAEAGRKLFAVSRTGKANPNDTDRLKKYLARFELDFLGLKNALSR